MKPRVRSVTTIPNARRQRTPQPTTPPPTSVTDAWPKDATAYYGRTLPDEGIGRIPCIGLDSGAIPGTRGDTSPINNR